MPVPPESRGTILIADDEAEARRPLAELLRRVGFTCLEAESGDAAAALLRAQPAQAVILDIHMPGNAELEMTDRLRAIIPALPVILLTGRPTVQTASRAISIPVTAYLTKPPEIDELSQVLDKAIATYRHHAALQAGRDRLREWDAQLQNIQQLLVVTAPQEDRLRDFQRLTLRQVILMLSDLERACAHAPTSRQVETDRAAALLETVRVLERTKQNFKSRELADLRKRLQALINPPGERTS